MLFVYVSATSVTQGHIIPFVNELVTAVFLFPWIMEKCILLKHAWRNTHYDEPCLMESLCWRLYGAKTSPPLLMRECHHAFHLADCTANQTHHPVCPATSSLRLDTYCIPALEVERWSGGWSSLAECQGSMGSCGVRTDSRKPLMFFFFSETVYPQCIFKCWKAADNKMIISHDSMEIIAELPLSLQKTWPCIKAANSLKMQKRGMLIRFRDCVY